MFRSASKGFARRTTYPISWGLKLVFVLVHLFCNQKCTENSAIVSSWVGMVYCLFESLTIGESKRNTNNTEG